MSTEAMKLTAAMAVLAPAARAIALENFSMISEAQVVRRAAGQALSRFDVALQHTSVRWLMHESVMIGHMAQAQMGLEMLAGRYPWFSGLQGRSPCASDASMSHGTDCSEQQSVARGESGGGR